MRIVAGVHRGRRLDVPAGVTTRPTSDKARGAIFNKLMHGIPGFQIAGSRVADLFAGSGALGLEALSRGADHCTFVERNGRTANLLKENIEALSETDRAVLIRGDATKLAPVSAPFNLVFLDPPYGKGLAPRALQALAAMDWLAPDGVCVAEIGAGEDLEPPPGLKALDTRTYGAAKVIYLYHAG